jgi:hypothetical protein
MKRTLTVLLISCAFGLTVKASANETILVDNLPSWLVTPAPFKPSTFHAAKSKEPCHTNFLQDDISVGFCANPENTWGFFLTNHQSTHINPEGGQAFREYIFSASGPQRQDLELEISELGTQEAPHSQLWDMHSHFVFLPRKKLPSIQLQEDSHHHPFYRVSLPTEEIVEFDATTKEIQSGALQELKAIDTNLNPQMRKFPEIKYRGLGLMIRLDLQGDQDLTKPTKKRSNSILQAQPAKLVAQYREMRCPLAPPLLWESKNGQTSFKYQDDKDVVKIVNRECGWQIPLESAGPRLSAAPQGTKALP